MRLVTCGDSVWKEFRRRGGMLSHGFRTGQGHGERGEIRRQIDLPRLDLDPDGVEDPVDERRRLLVAELLGDLYRFVDDDHPGRGREEQELLSLIHISEPTRQAE